MKSNPRSFGRVGTLEVGMDANKKWLREATARTLEEIAARMEQLAFARTRRKRVVAVGTVEYLLHALLGLGPWPSTPRDLASLDDLVDVLEDRLPHETTRLIRAHIRDHHIQTATRPAGGEAHG